MDRLASLCIEHLLLRIRMLNRVMHDAVARQQSANRSLALSKAKGLYLTDTQVKDLLARADQFARRVAPAQAAAAVPADDVAAENELRQQALTAPAALPFDRLAHQGLTRQEQDAIALCAAPELDRAYERIYAYILDDLTRRAPSVALLSELTCTTAVQRAWSLHVFGPFGALRRRRLLVAAGEPLSEARQELRLGPGVLDFLLASGSSPAAMFRDRAELPVGEPVAAPQGVDADEIDTLGEAFRRGTLALLGVWGADAGTVADTVRAVVSAAGLPVRRLVTGDIKCRESCPREEVRKAFLASGTLQTALWVEADELTGDAGEAALETLREQLVVSPVPVIITGRAPWRPSEALASRAYAELQIDLPGYGGRQQMWRAAVPEVGAERSRQLAARYRLTTTELRAATRLAGTRVALDTNGQRPSMDEYLDGACAVVTRRATLSFARLLAPRRQASDLVLPADVYQQVLEIARFQHAAPRVAEEWGFSRLDPGAGALRALFTGDPGTGKTLAAEVIAAELGAPLIKVDLARVVSKWVGETEKNLSAVFDEARSMHAVLFFDEADALFGRRGEVQRGMDRYANLEVSYLLQRLEEHDAGVVILASNLKDNIDSAFTRRFQVALHFPRPSPDLRRRLWQLAIPSGAPRGDIDFDTLARLDLTGGGIVGAARTAALLAADAGSEVIAMAHVVRGLARQFKREARLLTPAELGSYASLLQEA